VGRALSDSHFVAMFPALARARLGIERADWAGARRAAGTAVELGRRGVAALTRQEGLIESLTDRELTILRLLPAPSSLRELASELFVTPNTLKTHLRAIYRKLGAESREEAVIRARERGLI
jgi:LuxR family transcriptional regulator, maltose regulon positive regulatory protein